MTKRDIQFFFDYDHWANGRMLGSVSTLTVEQFTRDLGGSFHSIRDTLAHILGGQWIWLQYWKNPPQSPEALSDLQKSRDEQFRPESFPHLAALLRKWMQVEKELADFIHRQDDQSLQQMLPFEESHIKLVHLMHHVANHSTYHRGQVALMIRQLGKEPIATDLHVFVAETEQSSN